MVIDRNDRPRSSPSLSFFFLFFLCGCCCCWWNLVRPVGQKSSRPECWMRLLSISNYAVPLSLSSHSSHLMNFGPFCKSFHRQCQLSSFLPGKLSRGSLLCSQLGQSKKKSCRRFSTVALVLEKAGRLGSSFVASRTVSIGFSYLRATSLLQHSFTRSVYPFPRVVGRRRHSVH